MPTDRIPPLDHVRFVRPRAGREGSSAVDWVGVVANRNSGMGRGLRLVNRLAGALRRVGFADQVAWTPEERALDGEPVRRRPDIAAVWSPWEATALSRPCSTSSPGVPLTVLPAGTENLVARHFGLRKDPDELARTIADARPVRVDVGLVAGRRFLLMAGFGFDGEIVSRHHSGPRFPFRLGTSHSPDRLRLADSCFELHVPVPTDHGSDR